MNKKILKWIICLGCLVSACGLFVSCGTDLFSEAFFRAAALDGKEGQDSMEQHDGRDALTSNDGRDALTSNDGRDALTFNDNVSGNAVNAVVASGPGIHSDGRVTKEMQTAQFWIDHTMASGQVLMGEEEIAAYNESVRGQLAADEGAEYYDLDSFGPSVSGEKLLALMKKNIHSWSVRQIEYEKNCDWTDLDPETEIRYGIICRRADMRALPTEEVVPDETASHDVLQNTALAVNEPVLILHTSKDGKWYFAVAEEYAGWIPVSAVGICKNAVEWREWKENEHFLVVTGDRINLYKLEGNSLSADCEFTMGTKLPLAENREWQNTEEAASVWDSYVVRIPDRDGEGNFICHLATVPLNRDVSVGYMEYTKENILRQAFKMLGNPYGWGGSSGERDCSSLIRDIFLCFGFRLPRNSGDMAKIENPSRVDMSEMPAKQKIAELMGLQPGTVLQMAGHAVLYLGCVDQNYYVLSARGEPAMRVMVNDLRVSDSEGKTWAEKLRTVVGIGIVKPEPNNSGRAS